VPISSLKSLISEKFQKISEPCRSLIRTPGGSSNYYFASKENLRQLLKSWIEILKVVKSGAKYYFVIRRFFGLDISDTYDCPGMG
jgi:hypothetical protein